MKRKDDTKWLWYFISIGVIILFLLILLSSVIQVGERLSSIHAFLEYGFYGLTFILVYALILRPVHIILFSPSFSVETTLDEGTGRNYGLYKRVAKRMIASEYLPVAEKENLKVALDNEKTLRVALNHVYNKHVKKEMNQIIRKHAKTVMISTAISQNGRLDFFTVVVVNLKMIKELVVICGFRPSFRHLAKLTINVFTTALIAEGLENMNINELLPTQTVNAMGEMPIVKPLVSSVTQGIGNALLTLRIGIVTRQYLFTDAKEVTKEEIRRTALLEAAGMTPSVIGEALTMFPKSVFNFFKKKDKGKESADLTEETA